MSADIKQTLALIRTLWRDLPKQKADLQGYGDDEMKILETLSDEARTLRESCLEERGIGPSVTISGPAHEERLKDTMRQGERDKN